MPSSLDLWVVVGASALHPGTAWDGWILAANSSAVGKVAPFFTNSDAHTRGFPGKP